MATSPSGTADPRPDDAPRPRRHDERGLALAVPAHRRVRLPVGLPHGRADRPRRRRRLALRPPLRLAERLRQPARPGGRQLPLRSLRHQRPDGAELRARHERARHDVEDAVGLGGGARRPDDGTDARAGQRHPPHPPAGRRRRRARPGPRGGVPRAAGSRSRWCASRSSTTATSRRPGRMADGTGHAADATGGGVTVRLRTDLLVGIEGGRVRGRHVLTLATGPTAPSRGPRASKRPPTPTTPRPGWPPRPRTGGAGSTAPASRTTAIERRSSARPSPPRVSPTCRRAPPSPR